jgi:hypothetical protein
MPVAPRCQKLYLPIVGIWREVLRQEENEAYVQEVAVLCGSLSIHICFHKWLKDRY